MINYSESTLSIKIPLDLKLVLQSKILSSFIYYPYPCVLENIERWQARK